MQIERVFTYVENQFSILQATSTAFFTSAALAFTYIPLYMAISKLTLCYIAVLTAVMPFILLSAFVQSLPPLCLLCFVFFMLFNLEKLLTKPSDQSAKVIWIPDPPTFYAKVRIDLILYKNWHLQMQNKLHADNFYILIKFFKMLYVQSYVANNALV